MIATAIGKQVEANGLSQPGERVLASVSMRECLPRGWRKHASQCWPTPWLPGKIACHRYDRAYRCLAVEIPFSRHVSPCLARAWATQQPAWHRCWNQVWSRTCWACDQWQLSAGEGALQRQSQRV